MSYTCKQSRRECDCCGDCVAREVVYTCSGCGEDIFEGEEYWGIWGDNLCAECISDARKTAELEEGP